MSSGVSESKGGRRGGDSDDERSGSASEGAASPAAGAGGGAAAGSGSAAAPSGRATVDFGDSLPVPRGVFRISKRIYIGATRAVFEALGAADAEKYGITHVLNVGAKEDPTPEEIRMAYDSTDVLLTDLPTTKLAPALKIGIPLLQQAIKDEGRIVVCCKSGESRAPAVVIAFLCKAKKAKFDTIYAEVEAAFPGVDMNEGFVDQLRLLATGGSEVAMAEAADRRDTGEKRKGKTKESQRSRAKDRDRKNRGGYDD